MIRSFLEYIYNIKFDSASIGIQKNLLLAALLGVISNLPSNIKSNFAKATYLIIGSLLSTILTPFIMLVIESIFKVKMPPESGYGIAASIGIIGLDTIRKFFINKFSKNKEQ